MADLEFKAALDLAQAQAGLDDFAGKVDATSTKMEQAGQKGSTGFGLLQAGAGLALTGVGALALGVGAVGVAAFDMAGQANQATNDIQAALGVTETQAQSLADTAVDVFGDNFGASVEDATASLITVRQQMAGLADDELQGVTEKALALRDTFGTDIAESTNAANTLMQRFGLTSDQAFDFITSGMQRGLNASDDFLETVGEYSTQFASGGTDAGQFFSLLESGMRGGVLGTDKAADAFKEFRVRIQDGSDATSTALGQLGIDSATLAD